MTNSKSIRRTVSDDWKLRLCFYTHDNLKSEIHKLRKNQLIEWLEWRDPNGIYSDRQSRKELGKVLSLIYAKQLVLEFIGNSDCIRLLACASVVQRHLTEHQSL